MNYIQRAAINCTVMGAILERRAGTDVPQMPGRDLVRTCQRRHCAALSLRTSQVHSTQDRRHGDLHGSRQANRRGLAASRHQNISLLLGHRPQISQGHHDGGSRPLHRPRQQGNRCLTGGATGPGSYPARVRAAGNRGRLRMETHYRGRKLLSNQLTGEIHVTP